MTIWLLNAVLTCCVITLTLLVVILTAAFVLGVAYALTWLWNNWRTL